MSKLWRVSVTVETTGYAIVFADTADEAEDLARDNKSDILDDGDSDYHASASELEAGEKLPWGWSGSDTPYGAERTIAALIEADAGDPPPYRDILTRDMFAGAAQ